MPVCVTRARPDGLVVSCAGNPYGEKPGFYETACGDIGTRGSVHERRWPTCPECQALLLECREWMQEWWTVEEMTPEEAGVVLNASLGRGQGATYFPQNYVKMAVLVRAPGKD